MLAPSWVRKLYLVSGENSPVFGSMVPQSAPRFRIVPERRYTLAQTLRLDVGVVERTAQFGPSEISTNNGNGETVAARTIADVNRVCDVDKGSVKELQPWRSGSGRGRGRGSWIGCMDQESA